MHRKQVGQQKSSQLVFTFLNQKWKRRSSVRNLLKVNSKEAQMTTVTCITSQVSDNFDFALNNFKRNNLMHN